jgi:hypothetical protein
VSAAEACGAQESVSPLERRIRLGGWIGMTLLLGAFALRLAEVWSGTSPAYVAANVVGALLVAAQCAWQRAWPALVLELGWVVLTLLSLGVAT